MVSLLALSLLSCRAPEEEAGPRPLPDLQRLSRLSLDLRGRRPSEDELLAVEADPAALDALLETFLQDPGFGEQIFFRYADLYKTRADRFIIGADGDGPVLLDKGAQARFLHAVGDEPLRLMQRVVNEDLPWTEIVTADWTMADEALLSVWPLEPVDGVEPDADGWQVARYTDSRPAAGVITTNGLWWRYISAAENLNRSRAEAIARLLVCEERFEHIVAFSSLASTTDELQQLAQTDPTCLSCHVVLDPIGSYLFGFWRMHPESYTEAASYYPARERLWESYTGIAPGWYGESGNNLFDLGNQIAADPRFPSCAVEQGYRFLHGEPAGADQTAALDAYREAFLDGGLSMRALYRALVSDPLYGSEDPDFEGTVPARRLSAWQLSASVYALTGFRWTYEQLDMLSTDTWGVRVLAGGMDGMIVSEPARDHSASSMLVVERLSEAASAYVVEQEMAMDAADRRLFREQEDLRAEPSEAALRAQLQGLALRVLGRRVASDDPEIEALVDLWEALKPELDAPEQRQAAMLAALLRHPDFLHY